MNLFELFEGRNTSCIVVDVQPAYTSNVHWVPELMQFLNKQGKILMFVNAEDQGMTDDETWQIQEYWEENGFNPDKWGDVELVDKGYGYLRAWMDYGVDESTIIKTIRELYQQKETDSRMLFGGEGDDQYIENMENMGVPEDVLDDGLSVEWVSIKKLKEYSGSLIMGGGRTECLREVELMMNAFNIKYKEVDQFIYD